MSLSVRLTLWYTAIAGLVLLAATGIVYLAVGGNLQRDLDNELTNAGESLAATMVVREALPFRSLRLVLPDLNSFAGADLLVQVVDTRGAPLDRSESLGRTVLPLDAEIRRALADGTPRFTTLSLPGGRLRVYAHPVGLEGRLVGALLVARPLASLESARARLLQALVAVDVLLLLLAAGAGWAMARVALRPIAAVTATAEAIAESGEAARRVPVAATRDEVGALAATFNRMLDRLQAALVAQRRFVADASHELRTPLTTLRLNLSTLRRMGARPAEELEIIDDLDREVERLGRLVEGLLVLARADAGQPLARAPVALDALVRRAVRAAAPRLADRTLRADELAPLVVLGSADHLEGVVRNLLDNAIKYTAPGGQIDVILQAEGGEAVLQVRDDGVGIADADLPHVFERFYRAPSARGQTGAGLGLSIAAEVVGAHGGSLAAESQPGGGSTFTVRLPLAPAGVQPAAPPSEPVALPTGAAPRDASAAPAENSSSL